MLYANDLPALRGLGQVSILRIVPFHVSAEIEQSRDGSSRFLNGLDELDGLLA